MGRKIKDLDIHMVASMYKQGHSLDQIATYLGCAHTTVRSAMVRANIPRRQANTIREKCQHRGAQINIRPPRNPDRKLEYLNKQKYKETTCLGLDCPLPGGRFMGKVDKNGKKITWLCPACTATNSMIQTRFCYKGEQWKAP